MTQPLLDRARLALDSGDLAVALRYLIAQWHERPARELGDLIDQVDDRLELPEFRGEWFDAARLATDDLSRGPLLRAIRKRTLAETERFLALAVEWRDPRLTRVLLSLLVELPWTGRRSRAGWRQIFRAMARHRDPRLFESARTLPPTWTVGEEMQELLSEQLATSIFEIDVAPWPEVAALGALVGQPATTKAAPPETEADLLARIYEHPEDDASRAVYADCLLEREDPHGEFIALQLRATKDDAARKREAALLSKHRKAWLGPLAPVLRDVEFRRGFPAVATVKFRHQRDVDQHGHHAAWATIEELTWADSPARDDRLEWSRALTPAMHGLRVVHDPVISQLLAAPRPWRIQRLQTGILDVKQFHALIDHPLLPDLETLSLETAKSSWFNGIEKCPPNIELIAPLDCIDREAFVSKVEATPVETLTFVSSYYRACYSRDDAGKLSRLDIATTFVWPTFDLLPKPTIEIINSALKQIKFRALSHVDVTATIAGETTSIAHLVDQTKRIRR